jgi:hypothetical protein
MADAGALQAVPAAQTRFTKSAFRKLSFKPVPCDGYLLIGCFQQEMVNRAISGFSLDKLHLFLLSYNWRPTPS